MTFDAAESSRFAGTPVELYFFRYGLKPAAYHAYTNAEEVVSFNGIDYIPIPIQRDTITAKGNLDKAMLKTRLPKTEALAEIFRIYPPSTVVTLTIRQGHIGVEPADFPVCYTGRVLNVTREGNEVVIGSEAIHTAMRRSGLRRHYQLSCPHVLYGPDCRANKRIFPARVVGIDGTTISLDDAWLAHGIEPQKFQGGTLEYDGDDNLEPRTVLRVLDPRTILLSGFIPDMPVGATVGMALGCNHELTDCDSLHVNTPNYGGCKWIPLKSPFNKSIY